MRVHARLACPPRCGESTLEWVCVTNLSETYRYDGENLDSVCPYYSMNTLFRVLKTPEAVEESVRLKILGQMDSAGWQPDPVQH